MSTFKDFLCWYFAEIRSSKVTSYAKEGWLKLQKRNAILKMTVFSNSRKKNCFRKPTNAKSYAFRGTDKNLLRENMFSAPLIAISKSSVWTTLFIVIQQTVGKPFFELILVIFTLIICVKRCLRVCFQDVNQILKVAVSNSVKTKWRFLKTWFCQILIEQNYNVKWKASEWHSRM